MPSQLPQQLINGLSMGSIYALLGVGYTLIFGIIHVIFFAQGELSMLAAFVATGVIVSLQQYLNLPVPFPILVIFTLLTAVASTMLLGVCAERIVLKPLRNAPRIKPLLTSLGASIVLQNLIMLTCGPQSRKFPELIKFQSYDILNASVSSMQIVMISLVFLLFFGLNMFLERHRYGLAIRAIAQSKDGAQLMGIDIDKAIAITFCISSATAAVAGILMAAYNGVIKFDMGFVPGIKGFTVAILGGTGNIKGAIVAGLLMGIGEAFFGGYISADYKDFFIFAMLVGILVIRPEGILGQKG